MYITNCTRIRSLLSLYVPAASAAETTLVLSAAKAAGTALLYTPKLHKYDYLARVDLLRLRGQRIIGSSFQGSYRVARQGAKSDYSLSYMSDEQRRLAAEEQLQMGKLLFAGP